MQSTLYKMTGWINHKLELTLSGKISTTSDMQMIPPKWGKKKKRQRRRRGTGESLDENLA